MDHTGSHVKLEYVNSDTEERRYVIVPLHDDLRTGTLRSIADQAGANDCQAFLDEMDKMCDHAHQLSLRPSTRLDRWWVDGLRPACDR